MCWHTGCIASSDGACHSWCSWTSLVAYPWSKPLNESTDALVVGAKCSGLTSISQMLISGSFWTVSCKLLYLLYAFCCFLCSRHSKVKQCFQWETLSNLKRQLLMNYCNNLTTISISVFTRTCWSSWVLGYMCVFVCVCHFSGYLIIKITAKTEWIVLLVYK